MHWISVPLVSAGRLYGEIAVDNRHSRRKFDLDDFEHMTVFAALAARAFAIDEKRGMLPARPLTLLAEKVGFNKPEHHVLSCLLRFLTHWEGGLGFSRSLFFEWERGYGSYCFRLGVGQITQERWNEVVPKVRMLTLAEVLDETSIPCDPELNTTMRDCRIDGADIAQKKGVWDEMATTRLQVAGRAIDAETILCCKLEGPEEPLGLIVVDRRYQDGREQFWDADKAMLETFAHEATHILLLHRLHRAAIELQHNSHFGMIAKGIPHEFRSLLLEAKGAAYDIEEALGSSMTEPIREDLEILSQKLTRMSTTVTRFTEVLTGKKIATQLTDLVWEVCQEQRASLSAAGIRLEVVMEPVPPVDAFAGILRTALENLLRNSAQVLTVWSGIKMIEVGVHPKGHGIEVSVRDTGPGLRASIEQEFNRSGFGATSRPGEGLGVGLLIARWVAFLHGGAFDIQSTQPQGTRATLSIPTI